MAKVARFEFMGSWVRFWLLCVTGIGIPVAILYLINGTLWIEEEVAEPERLLETLRR